MRFSDATATVNINIIHENMIVDMLKYGPELLLLPLQILNSTWEDNVFKNRENGSHHRHRNCCVIHLISSTLIDVRIEVNR